MQILQWLFKVADEPQHPKRTQTTNTTTTTSSHHHHHANNRKRAKDHPSKTNNFLVLFNDCGGKWRLKKKGSSSASSKNLIKPFTILRRVDIGKAYFYDTLNLTRLRSFHSMKMMKKEDIVRGLGIGSSHKKELVVDGNKVLPINEVTPSSSKNANSDEERRSSDRPPKGDRTKTISRMKELVRWAAAAKSQKGGKYFARKVLQFRNKGTLKAVPDEDEWSNESPKISFRWEVESCSTTSSLHSAPSISSSTRINDQTINNIPSPLRSSTDRCTPRSGNWITTDSEFVVLEL